MTEALMGTCILAVTTIIFVWVCSEYQIYNNEHSVEEKLNATRLSDWLAVDDSREYSQEVLKSENKTLLQNWIIRHHERQEIPSEKKREHHMIQSQRTYRMRGNL